MPSQSNDEAEVFEITEEELRDHISASLIILKERDPNWRSKLAACCLRCSDMDRESLEHLRILDVATWMLYGGKHGYRDYIEKEV